ncbi:sugar-binding transcriptional regulator [Atopobacter phocae]|uniref:sugar-binding transcriptional regulator n=1 Tax=Atopobacter phocae TaxID=136492 RepID=UPI00046F9E24|nr:sugar-binding domain-containing protein [Atopobacter phocae]
MLYLLKQLVPDYYDQFLMRSELIQFIHRNQPVGRRAIALALNCSERVARNEVEQLKKLNLVCVTKQGITLSNNGEMLVSELNHPNPTMDLQMSEFEQEVANRLGARAVKIRSNHNDMNLGLIVSELLESMLPLGQSVVAVAGGTTLLRIANTLSPQLNNGRDINFVPARGGIGNAQYIQANAIADIMANRLGARHESLFVPEQVSEETYRSLEKEPSIHFVLEELKKSLAVLFSIGEANKMLARRSLTDVNAQNRIKQEAVGEAFGVFFNKNGESVEKLARIGLRFNEIQSISYPIAVVTGKEKAKALTAFMHMVPHRHVWLVLDEEISHMILKEPSSF